MIAKIQTVKIIVHDVLHLPKSNSEKLFSDDVIALELSLQLNFSNSLHVLPRHEI